MRRSPSFRSVATRARRAGARSRRRGGPAGASVAGARVPSDTPEPPKPPPIRYGIGLHLGEVTYGNIGVPSRLEFTVIGSAAHTAARVESMTKTLARNIV